jgi:hypothetical protein
MFPATAFEDKIRDARYPNLPRVEAGRHRPTLETLERVATALKVPVVDLILREK